MQVVDTLSFLLGRWSLERSIEDHRSGARGRFEGVATLVEVSPASGPGADLGPGSGRRAHYGEVGELHLGTHRGPASRRLRWVRRGDTTVMLYFSDGRSFVDLDLRHGEWRSVHHCGEDRYEIATVVRSPDEVHERWRVWGPTKNYRAETTLQRADAFGAGGSGPPGRRPRHPTGASAVVGTGVDPVTSRFSGARSTN